MVDFETALAEIKRGAEEILIEDELKERLKSGKKLKLKRVSIQQHQICI
jgi:tyrosyl-tRNA synthetase